MIRFEKPDEPAVIDNQVRQPGRQWLAVNPDWKARGKSLPGHWRRVLNDLKSGYRGLCTYSCLFVSHRGTVDHYLCKEDHDHLAYEWSNYRFCSSGINSVKQRKDARILDPHEVHDDWFKVLIPSMELVLTDQVPIAERPRAEFTLSKAGIDLQSNYTLKESRMKVLLSFLRSGRQRFILEDLCPLLLQAVDDPGNQAELEKMEQKLREDGLL